MDVMVKTKGNIYNENPDDSLGFLIYRVFSIRQKKMNEALASIGMNYVQYHLLTVIYWLLLHGESVNQMMLINQTKLDKSVVSNILRRMTKDGYVLRKECSYDTRAKIVTLTTKGEKLAEQAIDIVNQIDQKFWGKYPQEQICTFLCEVIKINV